MDQPDFRRNRLICLALALGTIVLFSPAAGFNFVHFDDNTYIQDNSHIKGGFSLSTLAWCWQAGYASNWHPLTWLSHALDCQFYGLRPRGHHVTNIALHALNSVLVFLVLRRMTRATWRSAMVAALFAWHPAHVESVAWISERKDVLSTFFWLLTLWVYVGYTEELKSHSSNFKRHYVAALGLFALALMSKPMVVTLPFLLLLLDWWPLRRFGTSWQSNWKLLAEKIPFILLSAICCVLTAIAQRRGGEIISLQLDPLKLRIYYALLSYLRYVGKLFVPVNLAAIYPQGPPPVLSQAVGAVCLLAAISFVAFIFRHKRPYWMVGWCWFLGTLVPVIGLVQVGGQTIADRYTYIPFVGLFIIICWQSYDLAGNFPWSRQALGSIATISLAACAWMSFNQLQSWRNSGTLFLHAATVTSANYAAIGNYAEYLADVGETEQAKTECEKALKMYPDYALANTVLGTALDAEGKYADAARHLKIALQSDPHSHTVQQLLGGTFLMENQPDEAARIFSKELETDGANPAAHCGLAKALEALQETTNAISHYRVALRFRPDYPEALNNLAWILAADPRAEIRNGVEAVKLASRACELTGYQQTQEIGTLAAAQAETGRFDDAVATTEKAHDLALAQGQKDFAARCVEMEDLYRSHRPYHQPP